MKGAKHTIAELFTMDAYNHKIRVGDSVVYSHETLPNCLVKCTVVGIGPDEVTLQDPKHPEAMLKTMPAPAVVKIANE